MRYLERDVSFLCSCMLYAFAGGLFEKTKAKGGEMEKKRTGCQSAIEKPSTTTSSPASQQHPALHAESVRLA